jgi:hypothetical protein
MQENQGIKAWQWIVTVIIIIVLVILGYYMFKGGSSAPTTTETPTTEENASNGDVNRVVVADQYPGNIVYVTSAQFAAPGWVAIHEDNAGTPGAIIGSAYFDKGINPGKITLAKKTVEGKLYYAMLHSDDGDKKFDATKDMPLKDASENIIMKPFRVSSTVSEIKG